MISFERHVVLPVEPTVAFDLSLSIDLHVSSMAHAGERAIAGVTSGIIGMGEIVTWRARHFGITWTMTSVISEWDRPHSFVDEQGHGPFAWYRHEHRFEPNDDATSTLMLDHVGFAAPLGPLGWIAERLVLGRYLGRLIDARNVYLRAAAERRRGG